MKYKGVLKLEIKKGNFLYPKEINSYNDVSYFNARQTNNMIEVNFFAESIYEMHKKVTQYILAIEFEDKSMDKIFHEFRNGLIFKFFENKFFDTFNSFDIPKYNFGFDMSTVEHEILFF